MLNVEDCALEKLKEYIESGSIAIGVECLPVEEIGDLDASLIFSQWFGVDARCVYRHYVGGRGLRDSESVFQFDESTKLKGFPLNLHPIRAIF